MRRNIKFIVLHCTFTTPDTDILLIQNFWRNAFENDTPAHHLVIGQGGELYTLADIERETYGVTAWNSEAYHISYIGGINYLGQLQDTRTPAQKIALFDAVKQIKEQYPRAYVRGHRDFPNKHTICPVFDAGSWYINALLLEAQFGSYFPMV